MWDLPATGKGVNEVRSIDLVGNHLYTFGVIFADSNAGNISTLRVQHLGTGKHLGTWRLNDAITIAAGCASGPGTFMAVTQDVPPRFVRGELPKQFLDA
ncbi:unnamed protein product [Polarella glacialis]|nr:unnamed protein product [Polarella glacialis]